MSETKKDVSSKTPSRAPSKPTEVKKEAAVKPTEVKQEAPQLINPQERAESAEDIQRKKDLTPVTGVFRNLETPGGILRFPFKKYKQDPVKTYIMADGGSYTIPMMVANHLNENCVTPQYAHIEGTDMVQGSAAESKGIRGLHKVGQKPRFSFQPAGFIFSPTQIENHAISHSKF